MITMCFFDKSNNSTIVNALKQKKTVKKNFSRVSLKWVHSKRICFTVSEVHKKHKTASRYQKVDTSMSVDSDQYSLSLLCVAVPTVG